MVRAPKAIAFGAFGYFEPCNERAMPLREDLGAHAPWSPKGRKKEKRKERERKRGKRKKKRKKEKIKKRRGKGQALQFHVYANIWSWKEISGAAN